MLLPLLVFLLLFSFGCSSILAHSLFADPTDLLDSVSISIFSQGEWLPSRAPRGLRKRSASLAVGLHFSSSSIWTSLFCEFTFSEMLSLLESPLPSSSL